MSANVHEKDDGAALQRFTIPQDLWEASGLRGNEGSSTVPGAHDSVLGQNSASCMMGEAVDVRVMGWSESAQ